MNIISKLTDELQIRESQVRATIELLDAGNTIPFIARYRKEQTGELDEQQIRILADRLQYLRNLSARREEVGRLIASQDKLSPEVSAALQQAETLQEIEDIYRPFRPKRRTRALIAKEMGLDPLADILLQQDESEPSKAATRFLSDEVKSIDEALQGAQDILAEKFADDPQIRKMIREFTFQNGLLTTERQTKTEAPDAHEFAMYFSYEEPVRKIPPHRILAINRGERLKVLKAKVQVDGKQIIEKMSRKIITNPHSPARHLLDKAIADSYQRLIAPSVEREIRSQITEEAEKHAVKIFAQNLRSLLMQAPVRGRVVLGIDPAYRTGCKVVVLNEYGDLFHYTTIYPHEPQNRWDQSKQELHRLINDFQVSLIVIGNGTASRETETLAAEVISESDSSRLQYIIVNEAGASVYSASDTARAEFPELDVSVRGAISIGRRVQDPLAELVKIDPKSIGVGLYQHDVNQRLLTESLESVVESCVNYAGVELNSASPSLLRYVAGLSDTVAQEIIAHRRSIGKFETRRQLLEVKGLGPKTFEQCAGFLRLAEAQEPLDTTAVHPESYPLARQILQISGHKAEDLLIPDKLAALRQKLKTLNPATLAQQLGAGEPTIRDILAALAQPGRDPRDELPPPLFRQDVLTIEDLQPGMTLKGTVQNVVDFGAFIDIGVKKAGLVHISQMSHDYVRHPTDLLQVGDIVDVRVLSVDIEQGRISLTMKD